MSLETPNSTVARIKSGKIPIPEDIRSHLRCAEQYRYYMAALQTQDCLKSIIDACFVKKWRGRIGSREF